MLVRIDSCLLYTSDLYIYVIDESRMSKKKTDTDFREELEQRAIVRKVIHLQ